MSENLQCIFMVCRRQAAGLGDEARTRNAREELEKEPGSEASSVPQKQTEKERQEID